jgi:hypothetical protein
MSNSSKETATWNTIVLSPPSHGSPSLLWHNTVSPSHTYSGLHLGVLAFHSISTQTRPHAISPPSNWLRLFLIQFPVWIPQQSHPGYSSYLHCLWRWNRQSVPKRRHIKFRRQEISQKKEHNLNCCFSVHFNKYETLSFQQMHNLLKHKNATVFV